MVQIVGDHTQADPSLHSGVASVDAAPKTMPALQHADPALATGPPLLSLFEPALLLFALAFDTFGAAIGNADSFDASVVCGFFIAGRVEGCIARNQPRRASQLLLVRLDRRDQQRRVVWPLLIHLEGSNDLILAFLDLDHLAELGGLARLALTDFGVGPSGETNG